jgi:hypothetical protein
MHTCAHLADEVRRLRVNERGDHEAHVLDHLVPVPAQRHTRQMRDSATPRASATATAGAASRLMRLASALQSRQGNVGDPSPVRAHPHRRAHTHTCTHPQPITHTRMRACTRTRTHDTREQQRPTHPRTPRVHVRLSRVLRVERALPHEELCRVAVTRLKPTHV